MRRLVDRVDRTDYILPSDVVIKITYRIIQLNQLNAKLLLRFWDQIRTRKPKHLLLQNRQVDFSRPFCVASVSNLKVDQGRCRTCTCTSRSSDGWIKRLFRTTSNQRLDKSLSLTSLVICRWSCLIFYWVMGGREAPDDSKNSNTF